MMGSVGEVGRKGGTGVAISQRLVAWGRKHMQKWKQWGRQRVSAQCLSEKSAWPPALRVRYRLPPWQTVVKTVPPTLHCLGETIQNLAQFIASLTYRVYGRLKVCTSITHQGIQSERSKTVGVLKTVWWKRLAQWSKSFSQVMQLNWFMERGPSQWNSIRFYYSRKAWTVLNKEKTAWYSLSFWVKTTHQFMCRKAILFHYVVILSRERTFDSATIINIIIRYGKWDGMLKR